MQFTKFRLAAVVTDFSVAIPAVAVAASPFVDVPPGRFYEVAVDWAAGNGITAGAEAAGLAPIETLVQIIAAAATTQTRR